MYTAEIRKPTIRTDRNTEVPNLLLHLQYVEVNSDTIRPLIHCCIKDCLI